MHCTGYEPDTALVLSAASAWAYSDAATLHTMLETVCGMNEVEGETRSMRNEALFVDTRAFYVQGTLRGQAHGGGRPHAAELRRLLRARGTR